MVMSIMRILNQFTTSERSLWNCVHMRDEYLRQYARVWRCPANAGCTLHLCSQHSQVVDKCL